MRDDLLFFGKYIHSTETFLAFLLYNCFFLHVQVMAAVPLLKFEMLPTAKRPQMDATEALTWDRSRDATQSSVSFNVFVGHRR